MKWLIALMADLLRASVLLAAFGSLALGLLAFAGAVSPGLALFANLAPVGIFAALLAGLLWLALPSPRRPSGAGPLALIALLVWMALITPDLIGRLTARTVSPQGETFKVVQLNLWEQDWTHNEVKYAWIRKQNPDAVMLEETGLNAAGLMTKLSRDYPYSYSCVVPASACSVLLMSKRKALAVGGSGEGYRAADMVWARFRGESGDYVLAVAHATWPMPDGRQSVELAQIAKTLSGLKTDTILAGDFNATPWSFPLRGFDKSSGLVRRTHAMPTFPAGQVTSQRLPTPAAVLPIDHVYSSPAWSPVSVRRGPNLGSDHLPLVATFARAKRPGQK
ncbi:MAG: endonuclease [Caulobacteraceae bacterium]|nr:endonuclease [Caulobacteraceae bacterium]